MHCLTRLEYLLTIQQSTLYLTINSPSDPEIPQAGLQKLEKWQSNWSMEFKPDKCEVIRLAKRKKAIMFPYKLHNIELKSAETDTYLEITTSKDLNWKSHIEIVSFKASNTLKFIKRNIQTNNQKIKEIAYNTYLEYWYSLHKILSYISEKSMTFASC